MDTGQNLSQNEANSLIAMEKVSIDDNKHCYPSLGGALRIPLKSSDGREEFSLDIWRAKVNLWKNTFQNRARKSIILARIDFEGGTHINPDGEPIPCPHLHIYKEGFADKWAYPLPDQFAAFSDQWDVLQEFMNYCNIVRKPRIEREIFT